MKKIIVNLLLAIVITTSLSTFGVAQTGSNKRIKSAINMAGSGKCLGLARWQPTMNPIRSFVKGIELSDCGNDNTQVFSLEQITFGGQHIIKSNLSPDWCAGITNNVYANARASLGLVPCRVNGDVPLGARWYLENINGKTQFRAVSPSENKRNTCIDATSDTLGGNFITLWVQLNYCHSGSSQQWIVFESSEKLITK